MVTTTMTAPVAVDAPAVAATTASRLPALDGVRGLAIGTVLVFHACAFWQTETHSAFDRIVFAIAGECWIGVDLFFVLSGFLITRILLRAKGKAGYYSNFYARRALRIFPLYYATIFAFCVVGGLALGSHTAFHTLWQSQGWLWLYAYNIEIFRVGHWFSNLDNCWSLAVEEQFYLVWPMVVALLAPRRLAVAALVAALGSIVLRAAMPHLGYSAVQIYVITPARCDGLMLGGAIAALEHLKVPGSTIVRAAIVAIGIGVAVRFAFALGLLGSQEDPMGGWLATAWTLVFAGLVAWSTVLPDGARINHALQWRPLAVLGKYSYGVYLLHEPLFLLAGKPLSHLVIPFSVAATVAVKLAIMAPIVVGIAVLSFRYFETPFLRLKERFG